MHHAKRYYTIWAKGVEDRVLVDFWEALSVSGVARMTFYEHLPKSPAEFCLWARGGSQDVRLIGDGMGNILAMYWLNNPLGKAVMIHFCFARGAFSQQRDIGEYVVRSLLFTKDAGGEFVLSSLMGLTPKVYRHALRFIEELGFSLFGILPKSCFFSERESYKDGVMSVLTRENFMKKVHGTDIL